MQFFDQGRRRAQLSSHATTATAQHKLQRLESAPVHEAWLSCVIGLVVIVKICGEFPTAPPMTQTTIMWLVATCCGLAPKRTWRQGLPYTQTTQARCAQRQVCAFN